MKPLASKKGSAELPDAGYLDLQRPRDSSRAMEMMHCYM